MGIDVDRRDELTSSDPLGMLARTEAFPDQCHEALKIAREVELPPLERLPGLVMVTGMGGSAVGGDYARALFEAHGAVPFLVNRDDHLPNCVGLGDLVFVCSYSGETEETLACYEAAKTAGARIVAITSGGTLAERAEGDGHPVVLIPGGLPPRAALGLLFVPIAVVCETYKLLSAQEYERAFDLLRTAAGGWTADGADRGPRELAQKLHGALPLFYGLGSWPGLVANRWRTQLNENAKQLAFTNVYPELAHNEIVGWLGAGRQGVDRFVVVTLKSGEGTERMELRQRLTEEAIGERAEFVDVIAQGEDLLSRMLWLSLYGDFVSLYLSRLNGVDPFPIDPIADLKKALAGTI